MKLFSFLFGKDESSDKKEHEVYIYRQDTIIPADDTFEAWTSW